MAPSTTIRRLLKEVAELSPESANPNPAFFAAPVSDSNLHEWHFTLLGPPQPSPYAGGLYHGRISLPAQYPLKPPNFRFLTPSGRFEVNREICLSISGFHEETWMPAWGVRTALTALRSFMSEPGTAGQVGGLESSDQVRKNLAGNSKNWKCSECGKSNREIMEEWWNICRDQGVKVDEEDLGLEALPDGMSVEAIDRSKGKGKETQTQSTATLQEKTSQTHTAADTAAESETEGALPPLAQHPTTPSAPSATSPTSPTTQPSSSSIAPSPSLQTPSRPKPSNQPQSQPPSQTSSQASTQPHPSTQSHAAPVQEPQAITLDRAITAIFLALCIMILKKIFLSSRSNYSTSDEWEIGLSREY